jgi:hypothetical protein
MMVSDLHAIGLYETYKTRFKLKITFFLQYPRLFRLITTYTLKNYQLRVSRVKENRLLIHFVSDNNPD